MVVCAAVSSPASRGLDASRGRAATLRAPLRLGVTGHTALTPTTAELVASALRRLLAECAPVIGVSCLARGADRIFASTVLEIGGHLEVYLPSFDYRLHISDGRELAQYDHLVSQASEVQTLPYGIAGPPAYSAATRALVRRIDLLVAVWDGNPDDRPDSTATAVRTAHTLGVPVKVVWPHGASRTNPS